MIIFDGGEGVVVDAEFVEVDGIATVVAVVEESNLKMFLIS